MKTTNKTTALFSILGLALLMSTTGSADIGDNKKEAQHTHKHKKLSLSKKEALKKKRERKIQADHVKVTRVAKKTRDAHVAKLQQSLKINGIDKILGNLKTRLQTSQKETLSVYQRQKSGNKVIEKLELTRLKVPGMNNSSFSLQAKSLLDDGKKYQASEQVIEIVQTFVNNKDYVHSLVKMQEFRPSSTAGIDHARRIRILPKTAFKSLLGFKVGYVYLDNKNNIKGFDVFASRGAYMMYRFE